MLKTDNPFCQKAFLKSCFVFLLCIFCFAPAIVYSQEFPPGITPQEKQGIIYYRKTQYYHARDKFIEILIENNQNQLAKDYLDKIGRLKNTLTRVERHRIMQFLGLLEHIKLLRKQIRDVSFKNHDLMKFIEERAGDQIAIKSALDTARKTMDSVNFNEEINIDLGKYYTARRYDLEGILKDLGAGKDKIHAVLEDVNRVNFNLRSIREEVLKGIIK